MRRIAGSAAFPPELPRPVVAIGNFDGVHIGHRRLIERAREEARRIGGTSVVYTFDPHPARLLAPAGCPPQIQTLQQKLASIEALGVDVGIIEPFTAAFAAQEAAQFYRTVLVERLRATAIVVGYDFTFGLHRHGAVELLIDLGRTHRITTTVLEAQFADHTLISSTNIRRLLERGNVREAAVLLGRPYEIAGTVIAGRGIGRELGARTANITTANELIPRDGVYITEAMIASSANRRASAITSIGNNPTFAHAPFSIETHVLDTDIELLGTPIALCFLERIRDQIAFDTPQELAAQIQRDIEEARTWHRQQRL